jgi:hypothetical protein
MMRTEAEQREVFEQLKPQLPERYAEVAELLDETLLHEWWRAKLDLYRDTIVHSLRWDFMRVPGISDQLVGNPEKQEPLVPMLSKLLFRRKTAWLGRDYVGEPFPTTIGRVETSMDVVRAGYHWMRLLKEMGEEAFTQTSVFVEWGGGYGCLAKTIRRFYEAHEVDPPTYVIVDLPVTSILQWIVLNTVFAPEDVHLLTPSNAYDGIKQGVINLLPHGLARETVIDPDIFVGTWSLSESTPEATYLCEELGWFNSRWAILGYGTGLTGSADPLIRAMHEGYSNVITEHPPDAGGMTLALCGKD